MARDLQVTFRSGRLLAAYLYFHKGPKVRVAQTRREADGMVVDFSDTQVPLGIEFVAPSKVTLGKVNELLASLGEQPASADELWPLIHRANRAA